ncbi:ATP-binding protein [Yinghuangia sp. YIM S09857]|uniref:ATP-binding protein n=1 Tax=Yinghuangia sp. YIM S09857 TaxID=3436929 RepID=UPI003F53A0B4
MAVTQLHATADGFGHHLAMPVAAINCPVAPELVRHLRNFVYDCTLGLAASADTADTARLLTSELVSNAVRHTPPGTPLRLELLRDEPCRLLLVTVEDADRALPALSGTAQCHRAESGRGLPLVTLLAEESGVSALPVGKRVWFALKLG